MILRAYEEAVLERSPMLYLPLDFSLRDIAGFGYGDAAVLKNGLTLGGPPMLRGCVDGSASFSPAKTHYIDTGHTTRTNLAFNPSAANLALTPWTPVDSPITLEPTAALPTLAGLPAGIETGFHCVGDSGGDGGALTYLQTIGLTYRCSAYVNIASQTATGIRLSFDGSSSLKVDYTTVGGPFVRIDFSHVATFTGVGNIRVRQLGAGTSNFYWSATLIEEGAPLGVFFPDPGQLTSGHAAFSGAANNSASDFGWAARGSKRTFLSSIRAVDTNDRAIFGGSGATKVTQLLLRSGPQRVRFDIDSSASQVEWTPGGVNPEQDSGVMLTYDDPSSLANLIVNGVSQGQVAETDTFPTLQRLLLGVRQIGGGGVDFAYNGLQSHFAVLPYAISVEEAVELEAARLEQRRDETDAYVPKWPDTDVVKFTPKAGLDASLDGSLGVTTLGEYVDIGNLIDAGSLTTQNPDLQEQLRETHLFDELVV